MPKPSRSIPQKKHNDDRQRRARSWCDRGKEAEKPDERFLFLWIAFNAAYGDDWAVLPRRQKASKDPVEDPTHKRIRFFLKEILKKAENKREIQTILKGELSRQIKEILHGEPSQYLYGPYWKWHWRDRPKDDKSWSKSLKDSSEKLDKDFEKGNIDVYLTGVFFRLYQLRNQIFHGGVTFEKGEGRGQIESGSQIMFELVPKIVEMMCADIKRQPDSEVWGKVAYPRTLDTKKARNEQSSR